MEDGQLVPDVEQQKKKKLIMKLHKQGVSSRTIATHIGESEGFYRTILRIVKRELEDSKKK